MIDSRKIEDLRPEVQSLATQLVEICRRNGIRLIITSTLRDYEKQNDLYAQGRVRPGRIVTNARGGYSQHNFGVAFDVCPIVNGKCEWNDKKLWNKIGELGESIGLEQAGRQTGSLRETAHFQYTQGKNLAQLRKEHDEAL